MPTLRESIKIDVAIAPELWLARVDTGELENAILNLAINARDAMPEGGKLTIGAENVTLTESQARQFDNAAPGEYVRLSMIDTGTGMPPEVLEHAFEPFFTTKAFGDGSGLGLSMIYGFATQSGGFPAIESLPDEGTTVSLYLPRAEASEIQEKDCRPLCRPAAQGNTILVVEDDPDVRRLTVTLLKAKGYTVLESETGEEALRLIAENWEIELLLSDVVLAGELSGPAVAEMALKDRPDLRILFMSGYAEDVIRRDREGAGRTVDAELLAKPFTRAQLTEKVEAALQAEQI